MVIIVKVSLSELMDLKRRSAMLCSLARSIKTIFSRCSVYLHNFGTVFETSSRDRLANKL